MVSLSVALGLSVKQEEEGQEEEEEEGPTREPVHWVAVQAGAQGFLNSFRSYCYGEYGHSASNLLYCHGRILSALDTQI